MIYTRFCIKFFVVVVFVCDKFVLLTCCLKQRETAYCSRRSPIQSIKLTVGAVKVRVQQAYILQSEISFRHFPKYLDYQE